MLTIEQAVRRLAKRIMDDPEVQETIDTDTRDRLNISADEDVSDNNEYWDTYSRTLGDILKEVRRRCLRTKPAAKQSRKEEPTS